MTTEEIIGKIKQRRQGNIAKSNSGLKELIREIRKNIVINSFSKEPDMSLHKELMEQLADVKTRLKHVNAFGG